MSGLRLSLGDSHLSPFRLTTQAYLYAAAACSGCSVRCHILTCVWESFPGWFVLIILWRPSRLQSVSTLLKFEFKQLNVWDSETQQGDLYHNHNHKHVYFPHFDSQISVGTHSEILVCAWGETSHGDLCLFVSVSHHSVTVKAGTTGVLTSPTLQILPTPPTASFLFTMLCLYSQYTPYLFKTPVWTVGCVTVSVWM